MHKSALTETQWIGHRGAWAVEHQLPIIGGSHGRGELVKVGGADDGIDQWV